MTPVELGPAEIFTLFFVTLGPIKLLGPFVQRTQGLDRPALRRMSSRVFGVALVAVVAGSLIGLVMLGNFGISLAALRIATGVIFFLVALRLVLAQYAGDEPQPPLPEEPMAATLAITFPIVVTPYGIAAVIGLLASAADSARVWTILALAAGMMVINFGAMLGARRILRGVPLFVLQVLSSVLGVVQVALAIEITLAGIRELSPARG